MANTKISALPAATAMANADVVAGVVGSTTEKVSRALVLTAAGGEPITLSSAGGSVLIDNTGNVVITSSSGFVEMSNGTNTAKFDFSAITTLRTYTFPDSDLTVGSGGGGGGLSVATASTTYVITNSDDVVLCDCTSAGFTITLPSVSTATKKPFYIKRLDSSGHTLTVATAGAENIDGNANYTTTTQYDVLVVITDGTNWWSLASALIV